MDAEVDVIKGIHILSWSKFPVLSRNANRIFRGYFHNLNFSLFVQNTPSIHEKSLKRKTVPLNESFIDFSHSTSSMVVNVMKHWFWYI